MALDNKKATKFFGTRTFFIRAVPKIFGRVNGASQRYSVKKTTSLDIEVGVLIRPHSLCTPEDLIKGKRKTFNILSL